MADGPVYTGTFADPSVLVVGRAYYAYSTNDDGAEENLPVIESSDLVHWKAVGDAMPILPSWVQDGFTWSPSVEADPAGGYELFFNAYDPATHHQCIGRATAPSPLGPFVSASNTPFLCQTSAGGVIDAFVYAGHDADYLLWKSDGETGQEPKIWSQELGHGDQTLVGQPVVLQTPTQDWEDGNIEGPALATIDGTFYLLFSGNHWTSPNYGIGATTCRSPLGPCAPSGPDLILASTRSVVGPGGPDVFHAGQQIILAYAATPGHKASSGADQRELYLAVVSAVGGNALSVQS
jgi:beta-xylosidase